MVNPETKEDLGVKSQKRKLDNSGRKVLSCQRCRIRKVKCDFDSPCSNCAKVGAECIPPFEDKRKKRYSSNYVLRIEKQLENCLSFIQEIKKTGSSESRQALINSTDLIDILENENETTKKGDESYDERHGTVYGPLSVYDDDLVSRGKHKFLNTEEKSISVLNKDPVILQCLKLFFTWQYPSHNMFIFRESFLIDFFYPKHNSMYCSKILILSICALGSKMSDDENIYSKSASYYKEARSLLMSNFDSPSITSLQSFLLLAFYDICNGSNSSGWMLSGSAMRMGFDLGFQLNPKSWFLKVQSELSPLDISIRSRIYWGCYMADHFISLLLCRPSILKKSDASIFETHDLPNLEWIDEYMYDSSNGNGPQKDISISSPLKSIINLIDISENMLNDIFTRNEDDYDNLSREDLNLRSRLKKVNEYNIKIMKWKENLPKELAWDQRVLEETGQDPNLLCIRFYYYILILCLNRPFVGIVDVPSQESEFSSAEVCKSAIEDLIVLVKKFWKSNGLRKASIFIVYCSILPISVIFLTHSTEQLMLGAKKKLEFFLDVLKECSRTWKLAQKSYNLISIKLRQINLKDFDQHLKPCTKEERDVPTTSNNSHTKDSTIASRTDSFTIEHYKKQVADDGPRYIDESLESLEAFKDLKHNETYISNEIDFLGEEYDAYDSLDNEGQSFEFLGGPPVLMTSDLFNEDWESFFPDYIFNPRN